MIALWIVAVVVYIGVGIGYADYTDGPDDDLGVYLIGMFLWPMWVISNLTFWLLTKLLVSEQPAEKPTQTSESLGQIEILREIDNLRERVIRLEKAQ